MRYLQIAHVLPGRVRLRLPHLRRAREEAQALAAAVAGTPGVTSARARTETGSVLIEHDEDVLSADALIEQVRALAGADRVLKSGEAPPAEPLPPGTTSAVARAAATFFRAVDHDLLAATDGRIDLGTLATVGFVTAGALEIAVTRRLPAPPWFNLAWWGFRTFMTLETEAIEQSNGVAQPTATRDPTGLGNRPDA